MKYKYFLLVLSFIFNVQRLVLAQINPAPTSLETLPEGAILLEDKTRKEKAFIRFWNMLPHREYRVNLISSAGDNKITLAQKMPAFTFNSGYQRLNPGSYTFVLTKDIEEGDDIVLAEIDQKLNREDFFTFIAFERNNEISLDICNDSLLKENENNGNLMIRQYIKDIKVEVLLDDFSKTLDYGERQEIEKLPLGIKYVEMVTSNGKGQKTTWTSEIDFKEHRQATLLIIPDTYERFRPRVVFDGPRVVDFDNIVYTNEVETAQPEGQY